MMFLTNQQLVELTGRKRRDSQLMALRHMGIEHKVRADGTLVVLASHVEKVFDGATDMALREKRVEPNWEAV